GAACLMHEGHVMNRSNPRELTEAEIAGRLADDLSMRLGREGDKGKLGHGERWRAVARRFALAALGGGLAYAGLVSLLTAASSRALTRADWRAAAVLTGGVSLVGVATVLLSIGALRRADLAPRATMRSVKKDIAIVKK